jgi:Flp pilus assembly protein CpaB
MSQVLARPASRPRFRLRRRPLPYWLLCAVVALATGGLVARLVGDAAAERARWGSLRPTVVLRHTVAAGEPIVAGDARVRMLPAGVVPGHALRRLPVGAVAAVELGAGEVLVDRRLLGHGPSAIAARLPRGTRAIAIPEAGALPLHIGDRVDVLATFDPETSPDDAPTFTVARAATVVHVGHDAVTIAVTTTAAPKVAYALAAGAVTLVLSGTS